MKTSPEYDISIVLPVYNEAHVLEDILNSLRDALSGLNYEILAVNDGSTDGIEKINAGDRVRIISHPYNIGNGAAIKSGMRQARGKVIVMMDADGQHDPHEIPKLLEHFPAYDMVIGARTGKQQSSFLRRLGNSAYNILATYVAGRPIMDLTSGFRAVKAEVAKKFVYLLPNTFSYPTTLTLTMIKAGYSVKFIPVEVKKRDKSGGGKSKIRILSDGLRFFLIILKIATLFSPFRIFFPISMACFTGGLIYGSYMLINFSHFSPFVLLLFISGVLVFLLGLIAEEINMIRYERSEE